MGVTVIDVAGPDVLARQKEEVAELVGVEGVRYAGSYGMADAGPVTPEVRAWADDRAHRTAGAWVEPKPASVAIHFRQAADPVAARDALAASLADVPPGYEVIEGRMVFEVVPAVRGVAKPVPLTVDVPVSQALQYGRVWVQSAMKSGAVPDWSERPSLLCSRLKRTPARRSG